MVSLVLWLVILGVGAIVQVAFVLDLLTLAHEAAAVPDAGYRFYAQTSAWQHAVRMIAKLLFFGAGVSTIVAAWNWAFVPLMIAAVILLDVESAVEWWAVHQLRAAGRKETG